MIGAVVMFAAEEGGSHTPFYLLGGALAVWAVVVAAFGIKQHRSWPEAKVARNGIMALTTLLVVATCASAVLTA